MSVSHRFLGLSNAAFVGLRAASRAGGTRMLLAALGFCAALGAPVALGRATSDAANPRGTEPLWTEDFEVVRDTPWGTLPEGWWLEGEATGARARIESGRLLVDATAGKVQSATVWWDRELPADVEVSFDVHVVDAVGGANNMNLFFQFRDPKGASLRETRAERADARYSRYHSARLQGTILTFLANGDTEKARLRVRQVPPFEPVRQERNAYHARAGHTYRVSVTRLGDRFTCRIDGRTLIDTTLPATGGGLGGGYLGFRTWRTKLWWDNIVVRPTS